MTYVTEYQRDTFAHHQLVAIDGVNGGWWFQREGTRIYGLVIFDSPVGLMLAGDLRFDGHHRLRGAGNGALWIPGYHSGWFGSRLNEDYLLEKAMGGAPRKRAAESSHNLAGWICAVQQRFAELFQAVTVTQEAAR